MEGWRKFIIILRNREGDLDISQVFEVSGIERQIV